MQYLLGATFLILYITQALYSMYADFLFSFFMISVDILSFVHYFSHNYDEYISWTALWLQNNSSSYLL